jgi:hypothetical protein
MTNKDYAINNHTDLKLRIMHLNALKEEQEEKLKYDFKKLYYSLQPATLIKNTLSNTVSDPDVQFNLAKTGVGIGLDLLIGKLLGKNKSIRGFISSFIFQKASHFLLEKHGDKIVNGISEVIQIFKHQNNGSSWKKITENE